MSVWERTRAIRMHRSLHTAADYGDSTDFIITGVNRMIYADDVQLVIGNSGRIVSVPFQPSDASDIGGSVRFYHAFAVSSAPNTFDVGADINELLRKR